MVINGCVVQAMETVQIDITNVHFDCMLIFIVIAVGQSKISLLSKRMQICVDFKYPTLQQLKIINSFLLLKREEVHFVIIYSAF